MTVLAYDPYLSKEKMAARNAEKAELKDILERADYITMHCPRTDETFGMIGYAAARGRTDGPSSA